MSNKECIEHFYTAFAQKDYETMQSCYHRDAIFSDDVFGTLNYKETCMMWEMLCKRAKSFSLEYKNISIDEESGVCDWSASYIFSATNNNVINHINAKFTFRDGKILTHKDSFSFYKWVSQALGLKGKLLGWSRFLHKKVQNQALINLNRALQKADKN